MYRVKINSLKRSYNQRWYVKESILLFCSAKNRQSDVMLYAIEISDEIVGIFKGYSQNRNFESTP